MEAIAWLDTVGEDVAATIRTAPDQTIVPAALSTSGARALAVMQQLAGRSAGASLQLVQGEVLGEGGMGVVRSAEQVALGRTVAVKTLKRRDPAAALDLLREAWVTGAIEHPNVVPVHFVELDAEGSPMVVLKRIEGAAWSELAGNAAEVARRFGATDLLAWNLGVLMQVLNAVRFAHHRGVIHRDLKPSNVMIGDFGEVYLLDWGIAVALHDDGSGRLPLASAATGIAGTPAYMAPEMLGREGGPPLSERTDVYLAGAVLYELITGRVPHRGNDVISVIASIVAAEPELPEAAPPELARICRRAMAEDPAQRFASAAELRLALQSFLEHRGSMELGARALAHLAELRTWLAAPDPPHDEVYRVFGAARFGFHEALAVWRENAEARAGLHAATVAVAEYELAGGHGAAALTLLADVDAPELTARAQAAVDASARERAALEHLRAQHDPAIGRRTRSFFAVLLGVLFTALPILNHLRPVMATPIDYAEWSGGFIFVLAALGYWARHTIRATLFNRRLFASVVLLFAAQAVFALGAEWGGFDTRGVDLAYVALWTVTSGLLAIHLDATLAPAPIAYAIALLVTARAPDLRGYVMGAANFVFALVAGLRWRPATLRPTAEERAVHERLKRS